MKKRVVTFHYTLKNKDGQVVDSSANRNPVSYLEGAGNIVPGLETELSRFQVGEKRNLVVQAAKGYGLRDERLLIKLERSKLSNTKLVVGDRFRGSEDPRAPIFTVIEISDAEVTLDGNHPLAGQDLHFQVEVTEIRDATGQEIKRGRANCKCGH